MGLRIVATRSIWHHVGACLLVQVLALALLPPVAIATDASGIFEVDLIFPRNDTYKTTAFMPVVFAVQNPGLAHLLWLHVSWYVAWEGHDPNYTTSESYAFAIPLDWLDATSGYADKNGYTYLATDWLAPVTDRENTWTLTWSATVDVCSDTIDGFVRGTQPNTITFTTSNTSAAADYQKATSADTCSTTQGFAWNVTGTSNNVTHSEDHPSCAIIGAQPNIDPCAVTINATVAANITDTVTDIACRSGSNLSCYRAHKSTAQQSRLITVWKPVIIAAVSCLVILGAAV